MNASLATENALRFRWLEAPRAGASREVAPGVIWLRMPLPFALDHINLWLLADGDGWMQVDCGYGDAATRGLWQEHFRSTLQGRPIRRVIATHYHPDHVGNAAWLAARNGCTVAMPQAEFLTAHAVSDERAGYGVTAISALFQAHGLAPEHVAALQARGNAYRRGVPELPLCFENIAAGDEITVGTRRWRVIPGYGHSPEHASLHCADLGVLISGDMLLPKISTNVSVWPVEPDGDPLGRFLASLDRFTELPSGTLVLPSHGLPFVGIAARVQQLRGHHVARLGELEAAASHPVTAADVVPVLFRRELDLQQRFFAMGEAIAHLNHLWRNARIKRLVAADRAIRFVAS